MLRLTAALLLVVVTTGCTSSTVIRSSPLGATVRSRYGEVLGKTPYEHSDSAINGHTETFTLEKDGYEPETVTIKRDQWNGLRTAGGIVGGFFVPLVWVSLLWATDYKDGYAVDLQAAPEPEQEEAAPRRAAQPAAARRTARR